MAYQVIRVFLLVYTPPEIKQIRLGSLAHSKVICKLYALQLPHVVHGVHFSQSVHHAI